MRLFGTTNIPLFLSHRALTNHLVPKNEASTYLYTAGHGFAKDCQLMVPEGSTVTYVALQLAYHLGFSSVALVGADHSFGTNGLPNKTVIQEADDVSHFHSSYFQPGQKWQLPDLIDSELWYLRARREFESDGRSIFNASVGGELDVFERISLEGFLER